MPFHVTRKTALAAIHTAAEAAVADARAALDRAAEAMSRVRPVVDGRGPAHLEDKFLDVHLAYLAAGKNYVAVRHATYSPGCQPDFGEKNYSDSWWDEHAAAAAKGLCDAAHHADKARSISARLVCECDDWCRGVPRD
jgi:hypothetical protein